MPWIDCLCRLIMAGPAIQRMAIATVRESARIANRFGPSVSGDSENLKCGHGALRCPPQCGHRRRTDELAGSTGVIFPALVRRPIHVNGSPRIGVIVRPRYGALL